MKHFTIAEFVRSDTADRLGIDNRLPRKYLANVRRLVSQVLDPLRDHYGRPIRINSGYRCPELNEAVKGAPKSYHLTGCAADIDTGSLEGNLAIFQHIRSHLPFTELGFEGNGRWIHVALVPGREQEKEVFYA